MASKKGFLFGPCLVLLSLMQVVLAKEELHLDVESFNSSSVRFSCRYVGNKTDVFFKVYRESTACIYAKSACNYYPQNDCEIKCEESVDLNAITFLVKLDGSCQEKVNIRCSVRTLTGMQGLELDQFYVWSAHSDPPEISINDGNLVAGLKRVPVTCTVANRCDTTMLEIAGAHMKNINVSHTKQGNRFTTVAKTSAIFDTAGNYTISCKEAGKGSSFSSSHIVVVQNATDVLTIDIGENRSTYLPTNKTVTTVYLVKNVCTKENLSFVESHDNSLLSRNLFFDEITSSRGESRFFSVSFYRMGKVNVTCRGEIRKSITTVIDVFDCGSNNLGAPEVSTFTAIAVGFTIAIIISIFPCVIICIGHLYWKQLQEKVYVLRRYLLRCKGSSQSGMTPAEDTSKIQFPSTISEQEQLPPLVLKNKEEQETPYGNDRERKIEEFLKGSKIHPNHNHMFSRLAWRENEPDFGECSTRLIGTASVGEPTRKNGGIQKDGINAIFLDLLRDMIVEDTVQKIFGILMHQKRSLERQGEKVNYNALFDGLNLCLNKGAHPTIAEIREISLLTVEECTTYEAFSATVQLLKQLIGAYRKQGNNDLIEIYLNPLQDKWKVGDDLRKTAAAVIRTAYSTLSNCIKSGSVINTLLFVSKEDGDDDIKKCFEKADEILQRDMRDSPVAKWVEETGKHVKDGSDDSGISDDQDDKAERKEERKKWQVKHFEEADSDAILQRDIRELIKERGKDFEQEKELRWMLIKRNDNWLRRNMLHLAAIFCHDEQVLNCIPKKLIKGQIDAEDLNGCTPMDIAQLHGNMSAIKLLKSHDARGCADCFAQFPEWSSADHDKQYKTHCLDIFERKSSVFEKMKKLLVLPVHECIAIEEDLKKLFTRMVANDGFLDAEIVMGGSVREKLKVGRWDEFDLLICTKIKPYFKGKEEYGNNEHEPFTYLRMHEYLVKRLAEVDKKGISLRCVSIGETWKFIWEGEGTCKGLEVYVDVVPTYIIGDQSRKPSRQGLIIDDAPAHLKQYYLRRRDLKAKRSWNDNFNKHKWDILDNLPPGCRLGILVAKALLEALDPTSDENILKRKKTSYVIKETLIWLLAGRTPLSIEKNHGNVIGERYSALRQQLHFTTNDPKWMTEEDVERFAEDGRFWAEMIFDAILFVAREFGSTPGNFLKDDCHQLCESDVVQVRDTCDRCLEKLRPEVFFCEESCASSADRTTGDSRLRTRLQKVIDMFDEKSDSLISALMWKNRNTLKQLKSMNKQHQDEINIPENRRDTAILIRAESFFRELEEKIVKVLKHYGGEAQQTNLNRKETECQELGEEIDKLLVKLENANSKESMLFRIRGEIEELERNKNKGLVEQRPACEREEELEMKRRECTQLKKAIESLHRANISGMEKLEKIASSILENCSTPEEERKIPVTVVQISEHT